MKTRIFNLIIIDESGSMQSIKGAAIDSVNETIQTIRSAQKKPTRTILIRNNKTDTLK